VLNNFKFYRKLRLVSKKDFDSVKKNSKKSQDKFFIINFKKNNLAFSRLGVIISKKSVPRAVDRNKLHRCVREWFRLNHSSFPGFDIVIIARHKAVYLSSKKLILCLDKLVQYLLKRCKSSLLEV